MRYVSSRHTAARRPLTSRPEDRQLLETCHARSVELLRRNLSSGGILAATAGKRAQLRGYTAIFGRDAAVCALGMVLSGDKQLQREAATGLHTLARHQAPNGQIPKFVDLERREADFWYLGCIDSTLWWLIALAYIDAHTAAQPARGGLRRRYARQITLALQWLLAQEHQRFFLLQQNEASDWADIMPRSGFVLYTNALWYFVKRLYRLEHAPQTLQNFNGLFHPFSAGLAEYRRARLLNDYVLRTARRPKRSGGNPEKRQWRDAGDTPRSCGKFKDTAAAFDTERANVDQVPGWGASEAYTWLGRCYLNNGDTVLARDALERALLIAPEFGQAKRLLSSITSG
jgi:tetratricopeptide (TPR) repeat protein